MAGHVTPGVWRLTSLCLIYLVKKYHVSCRSHCSFRNRSTTRKSSYPRVARLVDRKFQRKLPYSSVETMIFCRCSLKKSQWDKQFEEFPIISRLPANGLHSELCKQAQTQSNWLVQGEIHRRPWFSQSITYIYIWILYIWWEKYVCNCIYIKEYITNYMYNHMYIWKGILDRERISFCANTGTPYLPIIMPHVTSKHGKNNALKDVDLCVDITLATKNWGSQNPPNWSLSKEANGLE